MSLCKICPRLCGVDRAGGEVGYCGATAAVTVARSMVHRWEEPPISGENGAGAIFFSGCSLGCVYCQNYGISHTVTGTEYDTDGLVGLFSELAESGVHCLDLVTPTHYTDTLITVLRRMKPTMKLPVVWNSGGYELPQTLAGLEGLVDVYLPDFKYASGELAAKYSDAPDYPQIAAAALAEMYRQTGPAVFGEDGLIKRGVIVRHLVLPGCRHDSIAVLNLIAKTVPVEGIRLSLMSQYTPDFAVTPYRELHRRVTSFEYESVLREAERLGFEGWFQSREAADKRYTPDFR